MSELTVRRWLYLLLIAASTALATFQLWTVMRIDGLDAGEVLILALFAILFGWIVSSFWMACFGAFASLSRANLLPLKSGLAPGLSASRTAILMPVYNEDVCGVFAGLRAVIESTGNASGFDFYILSDSTDPEHWVKEELGWQALRRDLGGNIFYRHRPKNAGRKSGNIQDFCENWGQLYDYMVILDADSLMTGAALERLVAMMDANPPVALIQVPPQLAGRATPFARILQFASSVYGPLYNAGLAFLQGADGNYWGHNAIIRVLPFMQHCGLPPLPGAPPFGGQIMSHDFVEAALLRRAGWEVWMAPQLDGSFEQPPPTLVDYLKRDRRWCQGNLQHLRVLFAMGLSTPSRLHLAIGIMSFVSSPLWLLLLVVSAIELLRFRPHAAASYTGVYMGGLQPALSLSVSHVMTLLPLLLATAIVLYGPKLLALLSLASGRENLRAHGGAGRLVSGVVCESVFSTLLAPIVMLQHSWYVLTISLGKATGWDAQQRQDRALPARFVLRKFFVHSLIGAAALLALLIGARPSLAWFIPLLAGPLLAPPLAWLISSPKLGAILKRTGLFRVPSENQDSSILSRAHAPAEGIAGDDVDVRQLVLNDRSVRDLHMALLSDTPVTHGADHTHLAGLRDRARHCDTRAFSREDWSLLLSDAESLKLLPCTH